jgi:hypothetical protein
MTKEERRAQRAVGNEKSFYVRVVVPVIVSVSFDKEVNAVNKEDAIEQVKTIMDIETKRVFLNRIKDLLKTRYFSDSSIQASPEQNWTFDTQACPELDEAKSSGGTINAGGSGVQSC